MMRNHRINYLEIALGELTLRLAGQECRVELGLRGVVINGPLARVVTPVPL